MKPFKNQIQNKPEWDKVNFKLTNYYLEFDKTREEANNLQAPITDPLVLK